MPPDPPSLAWLGMYTHASDTHVILLLKILATGLISAVTCSISLCLAFPPSVQQNVMLNSPITHVTPTGNIPEAPELGTPRYKGQNVGPRYTISSKVTAPQDNTLEFSGT